MTNLNADYSKGVFSPDSTIPKPEEKEQLALIRDITQNFTEVVHLKQILGMTKAIIANASQDLDMPTFFQGAATASNLEYSTLACAAAKTAIETITANIDTDLLAFNTSDAITRFTSVFLKMGGTLNAHPQIAPSFLDQGTIQNTATAITLKINSAMTAIDITRTAGFFTLDEYIKGAITTAHLFINETMPYDQAKKTEVLASYIISHYPYLIARYITYFIRVSGEMDESGKPASFIVRQFAVLSLKLLLVQTLLTLMNYCPNQAQRNDMRATVKTLLRSIANEYSTDEEFNNYYTQILELSSSNKETREAIENMSKEVEAGKGNVEKAVVNDQRAVAEMKRAKLLMYIWLTLLLIFAVAATILVVLGTPENGMFYYLGVLCGIFVTAVFINGLVQIVRST